MNFGLPSITFPSITFPSLDLPSFEALKFHLGSVLEFSRILGVPNIKTFPSRSLSNITALGRSPSNSFSNLTALGGYETLYSKFKLRRGSEATISNASTIITPSNVPIEFKPYNLVHDNSNIEITFSDHPLLTISRISDVYRDMSEKKDVNCRERDHLSTLKASVSKSLEQLEYQISALNLKRSALKNRLDDIGLHETIIIENITLLEERMEYWENQISMFEGKLLSTDLNNQEFHVEMVI